MTISKVLYISYDGISDPLGKSQVLPYLKKLAGKNIKIFLISFEKKLGGKTGLGDLNIIWSPVRYHKGGILVKVWDIMAGVWSAAHIILKERIRIIHCRGYFPAFMAFCLKGFFSIGYIFDMRGLWVDERVDGGALKKGSFKYHAAKWVEKRLLISADKIVVLTHAMKYKLGKLSYLKEKIASIVIIPTCVDLELFHPDRSAKEVHSEFKGKFVVSYFGSIGTFYNFSAMLNFYKILSKTVKNAYLLIMSNASLVLTEQIIRNNGIAPDKYYLNSVSYEDVPKWLKLSDISIILYNRKYSGEGCCPTKLGESLACGIPVVINDGIGDCDSIIEERNIGVIIKDFTEASYVKVIDELGMLLKNREDLSRRCRIAAEEIFSLDSGVKKYLELYNTIA